jgi:hypothetical protein
MQSAYRRLLSFQSFSIQTLRNSGDPEQRFLAYGTLLDIAMFQQGSLQLCLW